MVYKPALTGEEIVALAKIICSEDSPLTSLERQRFALMQKFAALVGKTLRLVMWPGGVVFALMSTRARHTFGISY